MSGGMKVEEKKRAFEEWLQCNSMKYERYREKNVETKQRGCQILNGERILIGRMR